MDGFVTVRFKLNTLYKYSIHILNTEFPKQLMSNLKYEH